MGAPSCDPKNRLCRKLQIDAQTEYNKCLSKEAESRNGTINEQGIMVDKQGQNMDPYLGCTTDRLPDAHITVPVFAKYCSRHCYYIVPYDSIFYYAHEEKDKRRSLKSLVLQKHIVELAIVRQDYKGFISVL